MSFQTWLLFCGIAMVCVLSPGPAVLLSVTNSLQHGFRAAILSSLGNITGIFLVSGAAVLGLGTVLQASAALFGLFKVCGAVYLIYLGVKQWQAKPHDPAHTPGLKAENNGNLGGVFRQGVLVAVSNPKAVLFFTALFPQFIDTSKPVFSQFLICTLTFMAFSFMALVVYARGAEGFKTYFKKGKGQVWANRISGSMFILLGLGLLGMKRKTGEIL